MYSFSFSVSKSISCEWRIVIQPQVKTEILCTAMDIPKIYGHKWFINRIKISTDEPIQGYRRLGFKPNARKIYMRMRYSIPENSTGST